MANTPSRMVEISFLMLYCIVDSDFGAKIHTFPDTWFTWCYIYFFICVKLRQGGCEIKKEAVFGLFCLYGLTLRLELFPHPFSGLTAISLNIIALQNVIVIPF